MAKALVSDALWEVIAPLLPPATCHPCPRPRATPGRGKAPSSAIRALYQRLLAAGNRNKVALLACMRKLLIVCNAMLRSGTAWKSQPLDN